MVSLECCESRHAGSRPRALTTSSWILTVRVWCEVCARVVEGHSARTVDASQTLQDDDGEEDDLEVGVGECLHDRLHSARRHHRLAGLLCVCKVRARQRSGRGAGRVNEPGMARWWRHVSVRSWVWRSGWRMSFTRGFRPPAARIFSLCSAASKVSVSVSVMARGGGGWLVWHGSTHETTPPQRDSGASPAPPAAAGN